MADDYNMDASNINDLVSDFSATSEELVASISNITQAIDGITSASNDSATGTTNIAQKTIGKRSNPCTLTFKRPLTTVFLFSDVFWQLW